MTVFAVLEKCSNSPETCFAAARQFVRPENDDRLRMCDLNEILIPVCHPLLLLSKRDMLRVAGTDWSCSASSLESIGRACHRRTILK